MEFSTEKVAISKLGMLVVAAALSFALTAGTSPAGEHGRSAGDSRQAGDYESKIYGTVERLPQGEVGIWIVNGREIVVTRDTRIKEKHGKAEAGAYVEVEGNVTGNTFTAHEIKVKRAK